MSSTLDAVVPDVLIAEDVWGEPFGVLAGRRRVQRSPGAWEDPALLTARLVGVRALVVRNRTRVDEALLRAATDLQVIARAGVGLDNIDVAAADDLGIVVVAPLGANATSVAEHSLALALALVRELAEHDRAVRGGEWTRRPGRELAGRTWGLLGAGATARAVARLATAFGMRVLAHDPYVPADLARGAGIELVRLEQVLADSDVVSVHLPATPETRNLLGESAFAAMRPGSLLVSVGRGDVVDEAALAVALVQGHLGGAGLDVRANEPPGPGPLDDAPHVLFTPHVAGITVESQRRIAEVLAEDIEAVLAGGAAEHAAGRHAMPDRHRSGGAGIGAEGKF